MDKPLAAPFDIDNIMAIGLAHHMASDGPSKGTQDGKLSAIMLSDLAKLVVAEEDAPYLLGIKGVVIMLGDGLTELTVRQRSDLAAAEDWRKTTSNRIKESHDQIFWSNVLARALMFGGIGWAIFGEVIPMIHLEHHGEAPTSSLNFGFIGALVFAAASRVVSMKMANWQDEQMMRHYEFLRLQAQRKYFQSRYDLIKICRDRAVLLWKAYTGQNAPEIVSLLAIAAEELRAHNMEIRERKKATTTMLSNAFAKLSAWRKKHNHTNQEKVHV